MKTMRSSEGDFGLNLLVCCRGVYVEVKCLDLNLSHVSFFLPSKPGLLGDFCFPNLFLLEIDLIQMKNHVASSLQAQHHCHCCHDASSSVKSFSIVGMTS